MAIGSKYTPLTQWLQECGEDSVRLTFDELNTCLLYTSDAADE